MLLTSNRLTPWIAFLGLAVAALVPPLPAEDQPAPEEASRHGIFVDTIEVSLVNVEVVVTDKSGRPVTDLGIGDFEITDDGEAVEITNFYRVEGGHRALTEEGARPESAATPAVELAEESEPYSVIVLVDDVFISPESRIRVFKALGEQLAEVLTDNTRVMVARVDPEVSVEQRFTNDRDALASTLARLAHVKRSPHAVDNETAMLLRDISHSFSPGGGGVEGGEDMDTRVGRIDALRTLAQTRTHVREVHHRVSRATEVIGAFLGSLAGMPGRKALLYVCDQMPIRPGELVMATWWDKYGNFYGEDLRVMSVDAEVRPYDTSQQLYDLIADASASRVVFYPVGSGLSRHIKGASAEFKLDYSTGTFANQPQSLPEEGLRILALGTGGEAAIEVASPQALLERMRLDLTSYYSLAYPSPHRGDGGRHELKVRVKRPGVDVRYLESYRDKDVDQQMEDRTLSALLFDSVDNPLGIRVLVGEAKKEKRNRYIVPLSVRLPVSRLVLLPREKYHVGRVAVFIVARDETGRMSPPRKIVVPIEIAEKDYEEAMKRGATYSTRIAVRRGEQTIAVGVRDEIGATSATVPVYLNVGNKKKG